MALLTNFHESKTFTFGLLCQMNKCYYELLFTLGSILLTLRYLM
jgi:hypothetical protein